MIIILIFQDTRSPSIKRNALSNVPPLRVLEGEGGDPLVIANPLEETDTKV